MKFITDIIAESLGVVGLPKELAIVVRSDRPDLADFQCNAALAGARSLGRKPLDIAQAIVDTTEDARVLLSVAGPGFVNIKVIDFYLANELKSPEPKKPLNDLIMLDFGGPNVAKPMHVGHLRSLVIGDALTKILKWQGHDVITDIHWGDWGYQMGLLMASRSKGHLSMLDGKLLSLEDLQIAYPAAVEQAKNDSSFKLLAQTFTRELQDLRQMSLNYWELFVNLTEPSVMADLETLGITFDLYNGESDTARMLPEFSEKLARMGILHTSEGAQVIEAGDNLPPLMFRNSVGGYLYAATDLATIEERANLAPSKIIYVVDQRQELHFKQVFAVAKLLGQQMDLIHAGFGTIQGTDGKPLKTRAGGVPALKDMLDEAIAKALERNPDPQVAKSVAIAAVKFNDLKNKRTTNYPYDLDQALAHEGRTGPYMQYQVVRINSILAKRSVEPGAIVLSNQEERQLALMLANWQPTLDKVEEQLAPHLLADYLFNLAQAFSAYYGNHKVNDDPSRLSLALLVLETLAAGLNLLGIDTVEAM